MWWHGHIEVHVYRGLGSGKFCRSEDIPVFESPPLHTVYPSAPLDSSGITLNSQPAADTGHALWLFYWID